MKTAEQIAAQVIESNYGDTEAPEGVTTDDLLNDVVNQGFLDADGIMSMLTAAIEADRRQRAVVTPGHSADDIADDAADSLGIDYAAYSPNRDQVFSMCYEAASQAIDAVRAATTQRATLPEGIAELGAYDYSAEESSYEDTGYKVVQIDTENPGRIRVYVNDGVVYDGDPEVSA